VPELRHYELPSDAGGERAAAIYSLLGSAKLNDLDPEFYLRHVLLSCSVSPIIRERYANHRSGHVYGVSVRVDCRSFH
jgi:hypothetical protein